MTNYGTVIDNKLHPSTCAVRIGGAVERATSAEARAARLASLKAWLVEQRDRAVLSTTKAIYQAIIDRLEAD